MERMNKLAEVADAFNFQGGTGTIAGWDMSGCIKFGVENMTYYGWQGMEGVINKLNRFLSGKN